MDIFSAFGLSASAGLNAYIPLLVVALLGRFTTLVTLQQPWDALTSPGVIVLLVLLTGIEFFADKIPAVNHLNDLLQSVVRPAAGAIVFAANAQSITRVHPALALAAGLLVAGGVHTVKAAAVRPALTATTGGAANIPASIAEDVVSTVFSILAVVIPVLIAAIIILLTSTALWFLWRRARRQGA